MKSKRERVLARAAWLYDNYECPTENCPVSKCRRDRCVQRIAKILEAESEAEGRTK